MVESTYNTCRKKNLKGFTQRCFFYCCLHYGNMRTENEFNATRPTTKSSSLLRQLFLFLFVLCLVRSRATIIMKYNCGVVCFEFHPEKRVVAFLRSVHWLFTSIAVYYIFWSHFSHTVRCPFHNFIDTFLWFLRISMTFFFTFGWPYIHYCEYYSRFSCLETRNCIKLKPHNLGHFKLCDES